MPALYPLPHTRTPTVLFPTAGAAAKYVAKEIDKLILARNAAGKPTVLGLATGSTPVGLYRELIRMGSEGCHEQQQRWDTQQQWSDGVHSERWSHVPDSEHVSGRDAFHHVCHSRTGGFWNKPHSRQSGWNESGNIQPGRNNHVQHRDNIAHTSHRRNPHPHVQRHKYLGRQCIVYR